MLTVRAASGADLPTAKAIFDASWSSLAWTVLGLPLTLPRPTGTPKPTLIAETLAGAVGFSEVANGTLHRLYVLPTAQGGGVGRALLAASMELGARRLWVDEGNHPARSLYESMGWRPTGVTDPGLYWPLTHVVLYELPR